MFRRRRYSLQKCIIFVILLVLIFTIFLSFSPPSSFQSKDLLHVTQLSLMKTPSRQTMRQDDVPDIFELSLWRHILIGAKGNQTLCEVPSQYRPIANAFCRAQNRDDCPMIPCTLIYLTDEFITYVECLRGGKVAIDVEPDWVCRKSPALELFSNPRRKPSGLLYKCSTYENIPCVFDLIETTFILCLVGLIFLFIGGIFLCWDILKISGRSPILWINSNCDTPSNRTAYMLELMRYVSVDVRGKCGNPLWNESLAITDPKQLATEKLNLVKQYLFTVAIENSLEYDYVTEKLWQPLAAGSVPLYLGAPNVDEWLPCYNYSCIIHLRNFTSIKDVANLINRLANNKTLYAEYHQWRNEENVRSSFIKMINYFQEANQHSIECLLCDMVYRHDHGRIRRKLLAAKNPFNDTFPSLV
ncbi:unnamed protein product [Rotaria sp. Silwood1]|nr:unnamed protein product [Rotaria sp. Silwood1]